MLFTGQMFYFRVFHRYMIIRKWISHMCQANKLVTTKNAQNCGGKEKIRAGFFFTIFYRIWLE